MRSFDFSPLYRSTVGFDRLLDMLDETARLDSAPNWPPCNVEKIGDDRYRITMAVAGFGPDEIEITQKENTLFVTGRKHADNQGGHFLHRGIATHNFKQTFSLADYVSVTGASLENGLLRVDLVREVPEEMKPRRIEIGTKGPRVISHDRAA